jgi:16S rRNA G966 N2-methylase RsmD
MPTLKWLGKDKVINYHNEVPFRLLKENRTLSVNSDDTENLLIKGDNLEALKALLPYYYNQVKAIYIDPPYNTGNENWVFNDNVNSPEIKKWLRIGVLEATGLTEEAREKLYRDLLEKDDIKGAKMLCEFQDRVHPVKPDSKVPPKLPEQPPSSS